MERPGKWNVGREHAGLNVIHAVAVLDEGISGRRVPECCQLRAVDRAGRVEVVRYLKLFVDEIQIPNARTATGKPDE